MKKKTESDCEPYTRKRTKVMVVHTISPGKPREKRLVHATRAMPRDDSLTLLVTHTQALGGGVHPRLRYPFISSPYPHRPASSSTDPLFRYHPVSSVPSRPARRLIFSPCFRGLRSFAHFFRFSGFKGLPRSFRNTARVCHVLSYYPCILPVV